MNFLKFWKDVWRPQDGDARSLFNYRVGCISLLISFFGFFGAIWSIRIAQTQLNQQLSQLNAKSQIDVELSLVSDSFNATSTSFDIGPIVTSPIRLNIFIKNKGSYNPQNWSVNLIFCRAIKIQEPATQWQGVKGDIFRYESAKTLSAQESFFNPDLDSRGIFKVILPGKNSILWDNDEIPLMLFSTDGDRATPIKKIVFLKKVSGYNFRYQIIENLDEKTQFDLKKCRPDLF